MSAFKHSRKLGDFADRSRTADPAIESELLSLLASQYGEGNREGGDILGTYTDAAKAISGIVWIGGLLYMTDMEKDYLLAYDTATQTITDTAVIHDSPFSITWDGAYLWIGDKTGNVYAYNLDGASAGYSFSCPDNGFSTLAWDGTHFLTNFIMDNNPVISLVDETGQVVHSFKAWLNNMKIWQLVYAPEHHDGHFWFTNNSGKIGQIMEDEEEGTGTLVKQFTAPAGASYALAHDHQDLWYGKIGGTLYRVDDGIDEVNWLQIDPENGVIPAEEGKELMLHFDAGRFSEGDYHATMTVLTNDPASPEIRVPVELQVTGGVTLGPDTSFCGHLSVTLDAGEGFAGYLWSDGSNGQTLLIDSIGYGTGEAMIWTEVTDIGGVTKRDSILVNFLDCTSIFEFSSGLTISVFPNPNHGQFTISAKGISENITVTLSDMTGKILLERKMASPGKEEIDLGNYPKGYYTLRLSCGDGIKVEKVVIY
ncbi:MAG: T9SS type A sorting domain-containing protein [Bacteroidales bacterium]|nr:T9SS type A sorting domain-containing protein [Bacteroidales bacterium]